MRNQGVNRRVFLRTPGGLVAGGGIHARLGDQLPVLVASARFSNGRVSGSMAGRIDTADASRREWRPQHHLDPDLKPQGGVLNGAIVAIAGNLLSHWCELRRKASDADAGRTDPAPFSPVDDKPSSGGGNDVGPVNDRADGGSASAEGSPTCRVFGDALWRMER